MAQTLARPAAAEVKVLLQKLRLENFLRCGKSVIPSPTETAVSVNRGDGDFNSGFDVSGGMCKATHFSGTYRIKPTIEQVTPTHLGSPWVAASTHSLPELGSSPSMYKVIPALDIDGDVKYVKELENISSFLQRCSTHLEGLPGPIPRTWKKVAVTATASNEDKSMQTKSTSWVNDSDQLICHRGETIRVLQWNVLAQSLGTMNDNFVKCPVQALDWRTRRYRMLEELARHEPDVICLQEVDHFNFLRNSLMSLNFEGHFFPKPDSPCLYLPGNSGPDGCAIFYRKDKFNLQKIHNEVVEVWSEQSNQVILSAMLKSKLTGEELLIATTHLKARKGPLLATLRNEQGKFLLNYLARHCDGRPVICSGDFNAEPTEPIYNTLTTGSNQMRLSSAYGRFNADHISTMKTCESNYTSWKIREDGEHIQTLDYIFYSTSSFSNNNNNNNVKLRVEGILDIPSPQDIGETRLPNLSYASDHLSLVADFHLSSTPSTFVSSHLHHNGSLKNEL